MTEKQRYAGLSQEEIEKADIPIIEPEFGITYEWNVKNPEKIFLEKITFDEKFSELDRKEQIKEIESALDEKEEIQKMDIDYLRGKK